MSKSLSTSKLILMASLALSIGTFAACDDKKAAETPKPGAEAAKPAAPAAVMMSDLDAFTALKAPPAPASDVEKAKVALGQMLYHEKRLSKNHDISCNSCHLVTKFGVDNEKTSPGHKAQRGERNSPTSFNAAGHMAQFWDGRAKDVEEQAKGPILNPVEMAMKDEKSVVKTLQSMPEYVDAFKKAFPEEKTAVNYNNMANAIGAFERQLITPSAWDKMLNGDANAVSQDVKRGAVAFQKAGCMACHTGALLGGGIYQKLGLVKPWPMTEEQKKDLGRGGVTKNEAENYFFKVPTMRNITKTGPYLHDGSEPDLKKTIKMMSTYQLGKEISDADVNSIVTFLDALTANPPAEYLKVPELPKSTKKTPKPSAK